MTSPLGAGGNPPPQPPPACPSGGGGQVLVRRPVIGLVGQIGSGKSSVAGLLARHGCSVIDADAITHEVLRGDDIRQRLVAHWGPSVLASDGRSLDRRQIAARVFAPDGESHHYDWLMGVVSHPIRHELERRLTELGGDPQRALPLVASPPAHPTDTAPLAAIVLDAPLLIEYECHHFCDAVMAVECPAPLRLERVKVRGWTAPDVQNRERYQRSWPDKQKIATQHIDNSGPIENTEKQVESAYRQLLARWASTEWGAAHGISNPQSHGQSQSDLNGVCLGVF